MFLSYRFIAVRVCRYKANDLTDIELSKFIFTLANAIDISAVYICVELRLSCMREEHRLKVLEGRV